MNTRTKGIVLAGGHGTRLYPMSQVVTKQLMPIYDKPMIYYPLSILMMMNIRDILLIVKSEDLEHFKRLFGAGKRFGMNIEYIVQDHPGGLPEAFILGKDFIGNDPVTMILGDNIFYGAGLVPFLNQAVQDNTGASIFTFRVSDPERFGVVNFKPDGSVQNMEEKPKKPKSDWAMCGLYHFQSDVTEKVKNLKPSKRGELEMVDVLKLYLAEKRLKAWRTPRGFAWLDTGTPESMIQAGQFVQMLEARQGIKIACPEEIAFTKGYIDAEQLQKLAEPLRKSGYGEYLLDVLRQYQELNS